jgi:triosephosphate isomerase
VFPSATPKDLPIAKFRARKRIKINHEKKVDSARRQLEDESRTERHRRFFTSAVDFKIGAQNIHYEKSGAFTGEISASMLKEIGVTQALVGHSERRQYFGETNESVLKRTVGALAQGIEVLVCIGETQAERNEGHTQNVIEAQLNPLLTNEACLQAFGKNLHIAYEPVWAIGTGVTATPAQAEETHAFIRSLLAKKLSVADTNATRILYGGSVTPSNLKELLACENIDGGLVGGASVKVESWTALWSLCGA